MDHAVGSGIPIVGRFAPSPTGRMHLGNAYAALAAWLAARAAGGRIVLRIEDLDTPRVVKDAERWIMDDLAWLGLDWDGEPVYQSQRTELYEDVLSSLRALDLRDVCDVCDIDDADDVADVNDVGDVVARRESSAESDATSDTSYIAGYTAGAGISRHPSHSHSSDTSYNSGISHHSDTPLIYPCFCSRAEIRAASAPNEGDGFLIYPGTCRRMEQSERCDRVERGDRHSWRIAVPPKGSAAAIVRFNDMVFGSQRFDLSQQLGDVVIRRSDGLFAYQLAVSVDDLLMGVTQIVRGRDLLRSTAIQLWIRRCLRESGFASKADNGHDPQNERAPIQFAHLPLINAADGRRMAKRLNSLDLGTLREHGVDPRDVVGYCAWLLRIIDRPCPVTPAELVPLFSWNGLVRDHDDRRGDVDALLADFLGA